VSNKRTAKAGDSENRPRYVKLEHPTIDSMAFKVLSPAAVWLYVLLQRQYGKGGDQALVMPFSKVSWKLTFRQFDKARAELVKGGFIRVVDPGGLLKRPGVYALTDGWRARSKRLADDPQAGSCVWRLSALTGKRENVWYPARPLSESQANAAKARAAKVKKAVQKRRVVGAQTKRGEVRV
jgi:hypothetical protein